MIRRGTAQIRVATTRSGEEKPDPARTSLDLASGCSSQPLPSYRLREVSRSSYPHLRFFFLPPPVHHGFLICSLHAPRRACFLGAEGVGFRGAAVSLRRTCGWDRRRGVGPAAARCKLTHPASPTSAALEAASVRKHVRKGLTSAQTASLKFWYVSDSISFLFYK